MAILEKKKVLKLFDMPVMAEGKKMKQLNSAQLVNIIRENSIGEEEIVVVVEQVNRCPARLRVCLILVKLLGLLKVFAQHKLTNFLSDLQSGKNILS